MLAAPEDAEWKRDPKDANNSSTDSSAELRLFRAVQTTKSHRVYYSSGAPKQFMKHADVCLLVKSSFSVMIFIHFSSYGFRQTDPKKCALQSGKARLNFFVAEHELDEEYANHRRPALPSRRGHQRVINVLSLTATAQKKQREYAL